MKCKKENSQRTNVQRDHANDGVDLVNGCYIHMVAGDQLTLAMKQNTCAISIYIWTLWVVCHKNIFVQMIL